MIQSTPSTLAPQILAVEEQLRLAMLTSDVAALDQLMADDLVFTNHLGQVMSKQDDLSFHEAGLCQFQTLSYSEQYIQAVGDMVLMSVRVHITGVYSDIPFEEDLRFTRFWQRSGQNSWRIIAGHSSVVQGNGNVLLPATALKV